jgi:hypothetical protein
MKKIIVVALAVLFLFSAVAMAEEVKSLNISETLKKIPAMDNGGYYSLLDSRFNYSGTFKILETKDGKFALNAGYAGRAKETLDKGIVTVSYKLVALKDYVNVPILDLIVFDPYIAVGYGRINIQEIDRSEFDVGIGANIIKVNF